MIQPYVTGAEPVQGLLAGLSLTEPRRSSGRYRTRQGERNKAASGHSEMKGVLGLASRLTTGRRCRRPKTPRNMTKSSFVNCCTGRLAGLSPLRMRPVINLKTAKALGLTLAEMRNQRRHDG